MSENSPSNTPSLDVLYAEAQKALANQFDRGKQIEGKANILVGFAGVAATNLPTLHGWLLWIGAALVLATFGFGASALHPMTYKAGASLDWARDNLIHKEPETTKLVLVDSLLQCLGENDAQLTFKSNFFEAELWAFLLFIVVLVVGRVVMPQ